MCDSTEYEMFLTCTLPFLLWLQQWFTRGGHIARQAQQAIFSSQIPHRQLMAMEMFSAKDISFKTDGF